MFPAYLSIIVYLFVYLFLKFVFSFFKVENQLPEAARRELHSLSDRFIVDPNIQPLSDSHSIIVKCSLRKSF